MAGEDPDLEQGIPSTGLVNGNRSPRLGGGLLKVAVCCHASARCSTDADPLTAYREMARFDPSHRIYPVFPMYHFIISDHVSTTGRGRALADGTRSHTTQKPGESVFAVRGGSRSPR